MDTTDTNMDAPIHASLLYHNSENTKLLLEYKANLELTNSKGRKPIHNANDAESLELLLDHGADIDAKDGNGKMFIFNHQVIDNAYNYTSLHTDLASSTGCKSDIWKKVQANILRKPLVLLKQTIPSAKSP